MISLKSHGVMCHHFQNSFHEKCPENISGQKFVQMINWLSKINNLIGEKKYLEKAIQGSLKIYRYLFNF